MRDLLIPCAILALLCAASTLHAAGIQFEAALTGVLDTGSFRISVSAQSARGYDALDYPHPPTLPDSYCDFYSAHDSSQPGWELQPFSSLRYLEESVPPLGGADLIIPFWFESDQSGFASLNWSAVNDPAFIGYGVFIRDVSASMTINMRFRTFYDFPYEPGGPHPFELRFIAPSLVTPTPSPTPGESQTPTATPSPTLSPSPTVTASPTLEPSPSPTPTVRPPNSYYELFELSAKWKETNHTGPEDRNGDQQVNETDLLDLYEEWHQTP